MKKFLSSYKAVLFLLAVIALVCVLLVLFLKDSPERSDPSPILGNGMAQIYNGSEYRLIIPQEGVPVNELRSSDFKLDRDGEPVYTGSEYEVLKGIDVSTFQGTIDWKAVKKSGIDFAIMRCSGRGYSQEGPIYPDSQFEENLEGAKAAGLRVGVYFFSQATNVVEAEEEADYVIGQLDGRALDLPVFFDWESISYDEARTDGLDSTTITDCAVAFCERIRSAGYDAGVYFYQQTGYYVYDLSRLTDYRFWCASIGDYPFFYYAHDIWQYSVDGSVPGIDISCDMNMLFIKKAVS